MKIEKLKESHVKRNIVIVLITVLIITAIILQFTRAKYRVTDTVALINGTVNYAPYDFKIMAMYQESDSGEYESIDTIPTSGYTLNVEQSYCEVNDSNVNATISYDRATQTLSVSPMTTKGTKCYLYFDIDNSMTVQELIASYPTQLTRSDFSTTVTNTTTGTIYYADTSDGRTYYFAGNPTDNWVQFAGFWWRIIRINEDRSVRIIYAGEVSGDTAPVTTGTSTQIGTSAFNSSYNNNMYVGYMYTSEQVHGLGTDSTIKGVLDQWYEDNLQRNYASYLSTEAGFCGDRQPSTSSSSSNGSGGTGTTTTYYGAYIRLYSTDVPTFECPDNSDLYTVASASSGNNALDYSIGLITLDEAWYAGGYTSSNNSYYLYTNQNYWTMSPRYFYFLMNGYAYVFNVNSSGQLFDNDVYNEVGVRPVINLSSDVTISGTGTSTDPYQIVGA